MVKNGVKRDIPEEIEKNMGITRVPLVVNQSIQEQQTKLQQYILVIQKCFPQYVKLLKQLD